MIMLYKMQAKTVQNKTKEYSFRTISRQSQLFCFSCISMCRRSK